jgi:glutamate racemase
LLTATQPIGIFDSGVGGLTVVKFVLARLPEEKIVYFGDTARIPYGSRTPEEIISFGEEIVSFLLQYHVKAIVAACNTSSSVSLPILRERFGIPIIGVVEPGARAALQATRNGRVGVIATAATVYSGAYPRAISQFGGQQVQVFSSACPGFVELVEKGETDSAEARELAGRYLAPLRQAGIDTLVFGCTHYPLLSGVISEILGPDVALVDPAAETVRQLELLLRQLDELAPAGSSRQHRFFASGPTASFDTIGRRLLGSRIEVRQAGLEELKEAKVGLVWDCGLEENAEQS